MFKKARFSVPTIGHRRDWGQLQGAAAAEAIASVAHDPTRPTIVVCADALSASRTADAIKFFVDSDVIVETFADWETLLYDTFSPSQEIISDRLRLLTTLHRFQGIIVVPATTLMHRIPPRSFTLASSLSLDKGQLFDIDTVRTQLQSAAYVCVETVYEPGEYAVRGSIMDIFPSGSAHPYRIDLFDNEIDSLRSFDPETQRSLEQVDVIRLLPAREFPLTTEAIQHFQDRWHQAFTNHDPRRASIYQDIASGISPAGIEYYLPLFFDGLECLLDYMPAESLICLNQIGNTLENFWADAGHRYENLRYDVERPILPPEAILFKPDTLLARCNAMARIDIHQEPHTRGDNFKTQSVPDVSITERSNHPVSKLDQFLASHSEPVLLVTDSNGRREVVIELLTRHGMAPTSVDSWQTFRAQQPSFGIAVAQMEDGYHLPDACLLLTEQELFGEHVLQQRHRQQQKDASSELVIKSLTELRIGAPVVHLDHGIGRYLGLQTLEVDGRANEFLTLGYQDDARLYVPVSSMHLISRYSGSEEELAPLNRLGGDSWEKAKRKAVEKIHDVAAELLNIYARRESRVGHAFPEPDESCAKFAAAFPFEETPDQAAAIDRVITDMTRQTPMDHLICGDVGFGKTEVAMRAAFLAVNDGKQVAVLVPTTLLAQQHEETFRDRFADWPVSIAGMSRFNTRSEQNDVMAAAASGDVDIVIGTHALLQDKMTFKDLGLLIIDEEHRFGVRQKEKLKSLRSEVDILTLTATPIPRTLNMAMSGMRDLSIIATPPARRLSIRTFVRQRTEGLVKEAITRELMRGGQVYYLHNEVQTIENTAREIAQLIPEARVVIGHGQMRERQLEKVMSDFYHKRANVLVCTTIIETGIDIPSANTIIMNRADKLGLAQVHQLRGRVGRSHHQAYAYLLTPHPKVMTSDAVKRLDVISDAEDLGAGYILATHDLEIRGAGELLGEEQSGHLHAIGYSLFMELLHRAVQAIRDGKTPNMDQPLYEDTEINLHLPALIPEDYLPDVTNRLVLYKRIANADTDESLKDLQVEMIDRFGLLPEATKSLFRVTQMKLRADKLGIRRIDIGATGGKIEFKQDTGIDPDSIIELIQTEPHHYRLSGSHQLQISESMEKQQTRFNKLERLLERLEARHQYVEQSA